MVDRHPQGGVDGSWLKGTKTSPDSFCPVDEWRSVATDGQLVTKFGGHYIVMSLFVKAGRLAWTRSVHQNRKSCVRVIIDSIGRDTSGYSKPRAAKDRAEPICSRFQLGA